MPADSNSPVQLTSDQVSTLVQTKATCPFIASAIAQGSLSVRNSDADPLASIDDLRRLGNSGGGDLGETLALFATGNHAFMRGPSAKLDQPAPAGLFSLEFAGAQGSHPGHSGILQGDPATPGSGRFSQADFDRLTRRAKDGWIKRSEVGRFIAENLRRNPASKVLGAKTLRLLASDVAAPFRTLIGAIKEKLGGGEHDNAATLRELEQELTKLVGEDNLVGSAGEFGLLFAFLANRPGTREVDGEPAVAVHDLQSMFIDKRLPDGWETWKKTRFDWVKSTTALLIAAAAEYRLHKGPM